MICKKCANMFDDSLSSCPECGTPIFDSEITEEQKKKKAPFVLNIPDEEIEKPIIIKAEKANHENSEEEKSETSEAAEPDSAENELSEEEGIKEEEAEEKPEA